MKRRNSVKDNKCIKCVFAVSQHEIKDEPIHAKQFHYNNMYFLTI